MTVALQKPSRLARDVAKWRQSLVTKRVKDTAKQIARAAWDLLRRKVYDRENGLCRACGRHTRFTGKGNPENQAHCHHVIFRSAGGKDEMRNLANLCGSCHEKHHAGYRGERLESFGNAEKVLTFRSFNLETGQLLREWESAA